MFQITTTHYICHPPSFRKRKVHGDFLSSKKTVPLYIQNKKKTISQLVLATNKKNYGKKRETKKSERQSSDIGPQML